MTTLSPTIPMPAGGPALATATPRAELVTIRLSSGRRTSKRTAMHAVYCDGRIIASYPARRLAAARAHVARLNDEGRA